MREARLVFRKAGTIARDFVAIDFIDQRREDVFRERIIGGYARQLQQVADDKSDLYLIGQFAAFQSVVIPHLRHVARQARRRTNSFLLLVYVHQSLFGLRNLRLTPILFAANFHWA